MGVRLVSIDEFVDLVASNVRLHFSNVPEKMADCERRLRKTRRLIPKHAVSLRIMEDAYGRMPQRTTDFYGAIDSVAAILGVRVRHEIPDYGGQLILNQLWDELTASKARLVYAATGTYVAARNG